MRRDELASEVRLARSGACELRRVADEGVAIDDRRQIARTGHGGKADPSRPLDVDGPHAERPREGDPRALPGRRAGRPVGAIAGVLGGGRASAEAAQQWRGRRRDEHPVGSVHPQLERAEAGGHGNEAPRERLLGRLGTRRPRAVPLEVGDRFPDQRCGRADGRAEHAHGYEVEHVFGELVVGEHAQVGLETRPQRATASSRLPGVAAQ